MFKSSPFVYLFVFHQAATVTTIKEKLLKMLQRLREEKFEDFKWFLQDRDLIPAELPCIPWSKLEKADRKHVVDLMEQTYSQQAAEVTKMLFKKINRNDLVKLLWDTSSGSKAKNNKQIKTQKWPVEWQKQSHFCCWPNYLEYYRTFGPDQTNS